MMLVLKHYKNDPLDLNTEKKKLNRNDKDRYETLQKRPTCFETLTKTIYFHDDCCKTLQNGPFVMKH